MGSGSLAFSRSAARPATAGARVSAYDDSLELPLGAHASDPNLLHGFTSPHSRPVSAYRLSAGVSQRAPDSPGGLASSRPGSAFSAFQRTVQLSEVDRVKRAFAKSRIPCPLSTLEKALVVPEDRSYAQCVDRLPRPGGGLIPNPILAEKKKAGGGKKGGKVREGPRLVGWRCRCCVVFGGDARCLYVVLARALALRPCSHAHMRVCVFRWSLPPSLTPLFFPCLLQGKKGGKKKKK